MIDEYNIKDFIPEPIPESWTCLETTERFARYIHRDGVNLLISLGMREVIYRLKLKEPSQYKKYKDEIMDSFIPEMVKKRMLLQTGRFNILDPKNLEFITIADIPTRILRRRGL